MTGHEQAPLDQLRAQKSALADFGLLAVKCDDLDDLLRRAAELVSQALQVDLVKVLEHRPDRRELLIRSGVNWESGVVGHVTLADDEHSPGGYALLTCEPVISPDIDAEHRFQIPEVLIRHRVKSMVNVIIAGAQEPFGVLEVDARQKRDFGEDEVVFLRTYANLLAAAVERIRSYRKLEESAREQRILAHELSHRVKNLLSLAQALVSQTSIADRTAAAFKHSVLGRLQALATAEAALFDEQTGKVDLGRLAEEVLAPHRRDRPDAVHIEGPRVLLPARSGRMIGLALHELATNAAKYGALSVSTSRVTLRWRIDEGDEAGRVVLLWCERDGPEITPPERKGFGTRLLKDVLPHEIGGQCELTYPRSGLQFRLTFPTD